MRSLATLVWPVKGVQLSNIPCTGFNTMHESLLDTWCCIMLESDDIWWTKTAQNFSFQFFYEFESEMVEVFRVTEFVVCSNIHLIMQLTFFLVNWHLFFVQTNTVFLLFKMNDKYWLWGFKQGNQGDMWRSRSLFEKKID